MGQSNSNETKIPQSALEHYYEINKQHLQWSFWASLGELVVGLLVLAVGVEMALSGITSVHATLTTAGGVLTQFIGVGFFYLYSKNLRQSNTFFERLVKNEDTTAAIRLIDDLPEKNRLDATEKLVYALIMRNEPKSEVSPELITALAKAKQLESEKKS